MKILKIVGKFLAVIAVIASIFLISAMLGYKYITPISSVTLNANATIEYSLNNFDRVISLNGTNEIGKDIVKKLRINNMEITKAINETVEKLVDSGYISYDRNSKIEIFVENKDNAKANKLCLKLEEQIEDYLKQKSESNNVVINTRTNIY